MYIGRFYVVEWEGAHVVRHHTSLSLSVCPLRPFTLHPRLYQRKTHFGSYHRLYLRPPIYIITLMSSLPKFSSVHSCIDFPENIELLWCQICLKLSVHCNEISVISLQRGPPLNLHYWISGHLNLRSSSVVAVLLEVLPWNPYQNRLRRFWSSDPGKRNSVFCNIKQGLLSDLCWPFTWLIFRSWKWRRLIPPKH